jgi:hypothetical protein
MATVYIAPTSQGTGDGSSAANAYGYSSLSSAETAAGPGGTILFLDGTYNFSGNQTWDNGGESDMTYKSLNDHGAYLLGATTIRSLTIGPSSGTATTKLEGFKAGNIRYASGSGTATITLNNIKHADTFSGTRTYGIFYFVSNSNPCVVSNSSFVIDYSGSDKFTHTSGGASLTSCSFYFKCTSVGTGGISAGGSGPPASSKNTIFMSDNSNAINDAALNVSTCTNCCIYQMHANDSSGGTNNVFEDPQFLDAPNSDLRLRPTSPCIGAGTAS